MFFYEFCIFGGTIGNSQFFNPNLFYLNKFFALFILYNP